VNSFYGFDLQLSRLYTRKVYNRFKETLKSRTGFNIKDDPSGRAGYYIVQHRTTRKEFRVKAEHDNQNPERSTFGCECMRWENSGNKMTELYDVIDIELFVIHVKCLVLSCIVANIPCLLPRSFLCSSGSCVFACRGGASSIKVHTKEVHQKRQYGDTIR